MRLVELRLVAAVRLDVPDDTAKPLVDHEVERQAIHEHRTAEPTAPAAAAPRAYSGAGR